MALDDLGMLLSTIKWGQDTSVLRRSGWLCTLSCGLCEPRPTATSCVNEGLCLFPELSSDATAANYKQYKVPQWLSVLRVHWERHNSEYRAECRMQDTSVQTWHTFTRNMCTVKPLICKPISTILLFKSKLREAPFQTPWEKLSGDLFLNSLILLYVVNIS